MKRINQYLSLGTSLLLFFLLITGCSKDESVQPQNDGSLTERGFVINAIGSNISFYALGDGNELVRYITGPPVKLFSSIPIVGLGVDEHMLAIDFRPSDRMLYGVSDLSLIYIIELGSGQARPVSRTPFEPVIKGNTVGFDFDPKSDQIRLVTDQAQNLRIDPGQGTVISIDKDLNPIGVAVNSIAYSRIPSSTRTYTLFDIDTNTGQLYKQDPANDGTLTLIGSLGLAISGESGFDIAGQTGTSTFFQKSNIGYAVLYGHSLTGGLVSGDDLSTDAYRVYEINLLSGKSTYKGMLDRVITGIAIP